MRIITWGLALVFVAAAARAEVSRPPVFLALSAALEKELLPLLKEKELAPYKIVPLGNVGLPEALTRLKGQAGARLYTDLSMQQGPSEPGANVVSIWPGKGVPSLVDPVNALAAVAKELGKPSQLNVSAGQGAVPNAAAAALRQEAASLVAEGGLPWHVEIVAVDIPWPAPEKGKVFVRLSFAERPEPPKDPGQVLVPLLDPELATCKPVALYFRKAKQSRRPADIGATAFLAALARRTPAAESVFFRGGKKLGGSSYLVSCR